MSKQQKAESLYKMLTRQTNKPKSSSPPLIELRNILNGKIKLREDNPKLRLSIEDYNLMCKNKILRNMMAKILNIDIDILATYCKEDVKILEGYIDLSSMSIKEKAKAKLLPIKTLLTDLPDESLKLITEHYQSLLKYKLVDWFPKDNLINEFVSYNPNSIDFLRLPENRIFIDWNALSANPKAIDFLSENKQHINYSELSFNKSLNPKMINLLKEYIKETPARSRQIQMEEWEELSSNPAAIDILISPKNFQYINWRSLSSNPSPKAIEFLLLDKNRDFVKWDEFSSNPCDNAIKFLKENPEYIDKIGLSRNTNPKAIPLIAKQIKKENEHTKYTDKIDWTELCANPNGINLIIEKIKEGDKSHDIHWAILSGNPAIFIGLSKNILRDEIPKNKLDLRFLLFNPNAIDLIRERIYFENKLSKEEYDRLPSKIDWSKACLKPKLLDLTKERIYYENQLSKEEYDRLPSKIDWSYLSRIPEAIDILKENYSKIDWEKLSTNPAAIELLEAEYNKNHDTTKINWGALSANPAIFIL